LAQVPLGQVLWQIPVWAPCWYWTQVRPSTHWRLLSQVSPILRVLVTPPPVSPLQK